MKQVLSLPPNFKGNPKDLIVYDPGFRVVLIDPPWNFETYSGVNSKVDKHYKTQHIEWIKSLPIKSVCSSDCVLFCWITDPFINRAEEVLNAWGFTYKTIGFHWVKLNQDGSPFMGNGYWTRANSATTGSPQRISASVERVILSKREQHSKKPEEQYNRIEELVEGPYLEIFARKKRNGWTCIGNEVTGNDILVDLKDLKDEM
jgi:N6-adenosine-specific RNA methylase IME4